MTATASKLAQHPKWERGRPHLDNAATEGVILDLVYEAFPGFSVDVNISRIVSDGDTEWTLSVYVFGPDQEFDVGASTRGELLGKGLLAAWQFAEDVL